MRIVFLIHSEFFALHYVSSFVLRSGTWPGISLITVRTVYTSARTRAVVAVGLSFPVHSITVDFGFKGVMVQISIFIVAVDFNSPDRTDLTCFHPPGTTWHRLSVVA